MIKPLTSLRFVFALMVFLSHINFLNDKNESLVKLYATVFKEGFLGVSFFFILSGFVLALNYKKKFIEKKYCFKDFFVARIARIYPLHLFTLFLSVPLVLYQFTASPIFWGVKFIAHVFLLQSFIPIGDIYFSFNMPSWSISDELFFYIMFPTIILFFHKYKWSVVFSYFLCLLVPVLIYVFPENQEHQFFYVNPFFRIIDFILGILLYNLYERKIVDGIFKSIKMATVLEFISIALFVLFFMFHQYIPKGYRYSCYYWIPMIGIILVFAYQSGYVSIILSNKVFVFLGEISFGFYLIHQLAINYIRTVNGKLNFTDNDFVLILVIFASTLIGSYLSYKIIEKPMNKFIKTKFQKTAEFI